MTAERWLVDLGTGERDVVGGKAHGLNALIQAGFDVPEGFCLTAEVFEQVIVKVMEHAQTLDQIKERLTPASFPSSLASALARRLQKMASTGTTRWAVRSSAVAEDSEQASFAGQGTTVLNASSVDEVMEAICTVWMSHLALNQLLYRQRMGLPLSGFGMAVVVQQMIEPTCAGVLFTQNPLSDDPHEVVVSASHGLGTQVVDGGAQDTYYLDRRSGYAKHMELVEANQPVLADQQFALLSKLAQRFHDVFDSPRDVEWAIADDQLWVLQQRPITSALHESLTGQAKDTPFSVWSNANVGEALPGVGTPLTWSIISRFSEKGFERAFATLGLEVEPELDLVRSFNGRVYLNLTAFMKIASAIPLLSADTLFSMAGGGGAQSVEDSYEKQKPWWFLARLPVTIPRVLFNQLSMPVIAPRWASYFHNKCEAFFGRELERLHPGQLRKVLDEIDVLFDRNGLVMLTCSSNFLMSYVVMRKALKLCGGQQALEHEHKLVSALRVKSAEPGLDLLQLGRQARRSLRLRELIEHTPASKTYLMLREHQQEPEVRQFLAALDDFRKRHGHRAPREAELATPRWREDTTFIFEVLKGFVVSPHLPSVKEMNEEQQRTMQETRQLVNDLLPLGLRPAFELLLSMTRENARRREALRAYVVDSLDMYRRFFLECGRRMKIGGVLHAAEDVFYLQYQEILRWFDGSSEIGQYKLLVSLRRAIHEHHESLPDPPQTFIYKNHKIISEEDFLGLAQDPSVDEGTKLLFGLPGGAGRVSGRARVIKHLSDGESLRVGEVLVVPYADVGWTPLFLNATAVVMALGGPLSHACIVAREYGIPTVVNVKQAMSAIKTGDYITVDGDKGVVYVSHETEVDA